LRIAVLLAAVGATVVGDTRGFVLLLVFAAAWGLLEVLADSAVATLPALLLEEEHYDASYSLLYSSQRVANLVVGPAVGSVLIAVSSWAPFAAAGSLLAMSFVIQWPLLHRPEVQRKVEGRDVGGKRAKRYWNELSVGWRHILHDRFLRAVMITLGGIVVAEEVVATVIGPYVRDGRLIDNWESVLGFLRSFSGFASIAAALATAALARTMGRLQVMAVAAAGGVAAPLVLAVQPSVGIVLLALTLSAVSESLWVPLVQTEIARRTPPELMARTRATLMFVTWGALPLAGLVGGILAGSLGTPAALVIAGGIAATSSIIGVWPLALEQSRRREANA